MAKYLFLSDSPIIPTGFRNQSFLLAERLVEDNNEVFWIAPSHIGMPIKNATLPDGRVCKFTILPGGRHPHALDVITQRIAEVKPDLFYCLLDSFMLFPDILSINMSVPNTMWNPFKSALWFPSDGGYFPDQCELVLKKFDHPISMSKWGQTQTKKSFNMNIEYIPHGIKTNMFYPLSEPKKVELRKKYGAITGYNLQNKFVIGCVARNQPRKFMDRLIKTIAAFSKFAKHRNDVLLLLHTDPDDIAQAFSLKKLIQRYGIENKIAWTGMTAVQGFTDEKMNEVYNLFDVKLDTTSGEGFGITIIESMSCEVPVIITDYTTTKEIVTDNNAGLPIKLLGETERLFDGKAESEITNQIVGGWGVERGVCDIWHAVEQLQKCYYDWKDNQSKWLKEMGQNGRKAVLRDYDFDACVYPQWKKVFKRMLE